MAGPPTRTERRCAFAYRTEVRGRSLAPQDGARIVCDVRALAMICDKNGLSFTVVDTGGHVVEESDFEVPASRAKRGEQLGWLLEETEALVVEVFRWLG